MSEHRLHKMLTDRPERDRRSLLSSKYPPSQRPRHQVSLVEWQRVNRARRRRRILFAVVVSSCLLILLHIAFGVRDIAHTASPYPEEHFLGYSVSSHVRADQSLRLTVQGTDAVHHLDLERSFPVPVGTGIFVACRDMRPHIRLENKASLIALHAHSEVVTSFCQRY